MERFTLFFGLLAATPCQLRAWDASLLSGCTTCSADTQPKCMTLLETANSNSEIYDATFATDVTCDELEFAFECVMLANQQYPDGYLANFFDISDGETLSVCETYADYYDTKQCNTRCIEAGSNVQEGAMRFFCEQCTADTVADCYYYLGYSNSDSDMTCDSKQLALDCLLTNFTEYPDGYLAYMSSSRSNLDCESVAGTYSTATCSLRCEDCPSTCLFHTCDKWVNDGGHTCAALEADGCDCTGCQLCGTATAPTTPTIDDGWVIQKNYRCGRSVDSGLGANELQIGSGVSGEASYFDTYQDSLSNCQDTCEQEPTCGGLDVNIRDRYCYYIKNTRIYVESDPTFSCYTFTARVNVTADDVAAQVGACNVCTQDSEDESALAACMNVIDNANDYSWDQSYDGDFCSDLQTAIDCVTASTSTYANGYLKETAGTDCDTYLASVTTGTCSPTCGLNTEWCDICSGSTVDKCYEYMQLAAQQGTATCADLHQGLDCLLNQDYFSQQDISSCSTFLGNNFDAACGLTCPDECQSTCGFRSCDDIITLADAITCTQIENAWGCDCSGCSCDSSSAKLNELGYKATVGASCYSADFGQDTNRVEISTLNGKTYLESGNVDECAQLCGNEPQICGGFTFNLVNQECIFVGNATRLVSDTGNTESLCLENTGEPIVGGTTMDTSAEANDNTVAIVASVVTIVVVGAIVGVVVWRVKANGGNDGMSGKERPTTYAAPSYASPKSAASRSTRNDDLTSIDEDRQIDQDRFDL